MSLRWQRLLLILLTTYFTLIGGTFYTERSALLRLVHQALTALVLAGWLIDLWRTRRGFPATPLDLPLALSGGVWLVAAIFAPDPRVSLEYWWPIFAHILGFYLLVDLMRRGRQRWIMEALFTASAVIIILSLVEFVAWYFGLPLSPQFTQNWVAIAGLTIPPIIHKLSLALNVSTLLGNFTATLIPLGATWAMTARQRDLRAGLWLLTGGLTIVLVLTFSRGALMALATSSGILLLTWLIRDDVRARCPARLRPLLDRRLLIGLATIAAIAFVAGVFITTIQGSLSRSDLNRLDLWRSAIDMVRDRPLLGVGPFQYGAALRYYGDPELSQAQDRLVTAHNLYLHTLAESGVIGLLVSVWLGVAFARTWHHQWQNAPPGRRRRLEGGLAALLGFGIQSLVDTFTLTPLIVPLLVIAAYTVAGGVTRAQAISQAQPWPGHRKPIGLALAVIVVAEAAFLPVFAGNLAHEGAMRALGGGDLSAALAAAREARAADPWLALYPLHEAYILGRLAAEDPDAYLPEAIMAHETSQRLNPTWDLGWHNLGALYAQAGRYDEAAEAARAAIAWNPVPGGYHLKLGEYLEAAGRADEARAAYFEALRRNHSLGSSGFWTDPAHPGRADILADAVRYFADDPEVGLRLAVEAGHLEVATAIARRVDPETADYRMLQDLGDWAMLVNDETIAPCPGCYFVRAMEEYHSWPWVDYMRIAEMALEGDGIAHPLDITAEQAARTAIFIGEGLATRSWYILARLAEREGADDDTVNAMLARAVPPLFARQDFSLAVYGRVAAFDELPQARTPALYRYQYEPWLRLAERLEQAGDLDAARRVYQSLLNGDPYLWEIRALLENWPESVQGSKGGSAG